MASIPKKVQPLLCCRCRHRIHAILCLLVVVTASACSDTPRDRIERLEIRSIVQSDVQIHIENLTSARARERGRAIVALSSLGQKAEPAIPYLIILLDDDAICNRLNLSTVGDYAKGALCSIGKPSVEPLHYAVTNRTIVTAKGHALALLALGQLGDARVVEEVIMNLSAQDRSTRRAAAEALRNLRDARSFEDLTKALGFDRDAEVRWISALALGGLDDPRGIKYLVRALGDHHEYVRSAAVTSLERLTNENFGQDVEKWQQWFADWTELDQLQEGDPAKRSTIPDDTRRE